MISRLVKGRVLGRGASVGSVRSLSNVAHSRYKNSFKKPKKTCRRAYILGLRVRADWCHKALSPVPRNIDFLCY